MQGFYVIPRDAWVVLAVRIRLLPSFCLVNYLLSITGCYTMFSTDGFVGAAVDSILKEIFGFMTAKIISHFTNIGSVIINNNILA